MKDASTKTVSVIVVTCGVKNYLKSCLDSIKQQSYSALEIIVIDNSVDKQFAQQISELYPYIKLYSSPKNLSYCESLNKAIDMSRGDFILCLNDDVILDKRFIQEALEGFSVDKSIGMVSGKILRPDGITLDSAGLYLSCWRSAKERGYNIKDKGQYNSPGYIFGVNGAVAFYRKNMLEQIKIDSEYFDADFRFFYEDLDIAWRAQNLGWKGYYIPNAVAYHLRGATVRQGRGIDKRYARHYLSDELHLDLVKNRYLTIIKNESLLGFLLYLPFVIFYEIFLWGYILLFRFKLMKKIFSIRPAINSAFKKRTLLNRR
ncbi:MAG: glycosyltransferase family 2 protein [Candidatus Omnitrophica bacterium]|nr:glycosyltransferase family 2 protein [Candidatus Omnitrophota bacterium]